MVLSLREILEFDNLLKASITDAFNNFSCNKDLDVENFLKNLAIKYEQNNKARTFFIVDEDKESFNIEAYFTLALNVFEYKETTTKKCRQDTNLGASKRVAAYLIGQIGKNDNCKKKKMLPKLLDLVFENIREASNIVGGRIVYLDVKKNSRVIKMYSEYGFKVAVDTPDDHNLIQMYYVI